MQLKLFDGNNILIKYYAHKRGSLNKFVGSNSRISSNSLSLQQIMASDKCRLLCRVPEIRLFIKSCIFESILYTLL